MVPQSLGFDQQNSICNFTHMIHLGSSDCQTSISIPVSRYGLQAATAPNPWFHYCNMPTTPLFQHWPMISTPQTPTTQQHGKQKAASSECYSYCQP